jgi:hypothetical protein
MALVSPFVRSSQAPPRSATPDHPWLPLFLRRVTALLRTQARHGHTSLPTALLPSTYVYVNDLDRTSFAPWLFSASAHPLLAPPEPFAVNCYEEVLTPLLCAQVLSLQTLQATYRTSVLFGGRFWPRSTPGSTMRTLLNLLFQNMVWKYCVASSCDSHNKDAINRELV